MISADRLASIYDYEWCQRHKKRPLRLINLLQNRELEIRKPGTHYLSGCRNFYQCFKLECTSNIQSVTMTPIRFSPDGQQLISFNLSANEVIISRYNGIISMQTSSAPDAQKLFKKRFSTQVQGVLCRDLCLITNDSKHMLIAYVTQVSEQSIVLSRICRNNESATSGFNLENTTFVIIDLDKAVLTDNVRFENDSIRMSSSVYLVDRLLGILSVQHQTITLFTIDKKSGCLSKVIEIGRTLYEDDPFYLNKYNSNPRTENVFLGFRNRLFNYLYMAHKRAGTSIDFLASINHYQLLKMQKMQFLGPDIILIRLGSGVMSDNNTRKEEDKFYCMFVLFDWRRSEILSVFNRNSKKLFELCVNCTETFENGHITDNPFPTTMEHCQLLRQQHDNIIEALVSSNSAESTIRVINKTLNALPYSCTGIPTFTPFLDPCLFSFDDRLLSCIGNARLTPNTELKIYCRKTCSLALSIDISKHTDHDSPCRLLFHPTDPLALLSKQYSNDSIHIFSPVFSAPDFNSHLCNIPGPSRAG